MSVGLAIAKQAMNAEGKFVCGGLSFLL